mmetsp:Transcript_7393/g.25295  ORF Transcript_7393/g.25295 Transcript_7393/m.25295 type:complete len:226 (-) Transcript_7393:153-830(-)
MRAEQVAHGRRPALLFRHHRLEHDGRRHHNRCGPREENATVGRVLACRRSRGEREEEAVQKLVVKAGEEGDASEVVEEGVVACKGDAEHEEDRRNSSKQSHSPAGEEDQPGHCQLHRMVGNDAELEGSRRSMVHEPAEGRRRASRLEVERETVEVLPPPARLLRHELRPPCSQHDAESQPAEEPEDGPRGPPVRAEGGGEEDEEEACLQDLKVPPIVEEVLGMQR